MSFMHLKDKEEPFTVLEVDLLILCIFEQFSFLTTSIILTEFLQFKDSCVHEFIQLQQNKRDNQYIQYFNNKSFFKYKAMKNSVELNKQQIKQVEQFVQMTKTSKKHAEKYLVSSNWNFQTAINTFFDNGGVPEKEEFQVIQEVEQIFESISSKSSFQANDVIQNLGFQRLIEQYLKINLQNTVIGYIITHVMKIPKASVNAIRKECLYNLFEFCNARNIKDVIKQIPKLQKQHLEPKNYKEMYLKLYEVYLIKNFTSLDFEIAEALWVLYLKNTMVFYNQFIEYLSKLEDKKPKKIHKDLWKMIYEFSVTIKKVEDHKTQDLWPGFIDDFVDYLKENKK